MYKTEKSEIGLRLKAIGNEVRGDILDYLVSGEKCVCDIFGQLDLPQNLVSHHLGVLKRNGLIVARKDGKWVYYSLNTKVFAELGKYFRRYSSAKTIKSKSKCQS